MIDTELIVVLFISSRAYPSLRVCVFLTYFAPANVVYVYRDDWAIVASERRLKIEIEKEVLCCRRYIQVDVSVDCEC